MIGFMTESSSTAASAKRAMRRDGSCRYQIFMDIIIYHTVIEIRRSISRKSSRGSKINKTTCFWCSAPSKWYEVYSGNTGDIAVAEKGMVIALAEFQDAAVGVADTHLQTIVEMEMPRQSSDIFQLSR